MNDDWNKCDKCGTQRVAGPCDEGRRGCMVAHMVCPECRKIPCDVCGVKRSPEATYGICEGCEKAAVLYVAQLAHAAKTQKDALKDLTRGV